MGDGTLARSYGKVFNEVAVEYDRHRPAYPDVLVDRACEVAGLRDGDLVLEIGCGTGQLTRSLLARGLRVTALEPGDHAGEIAASWPTYRDLDCTIAGVRERCGNVADAWAWLGGYDIGRDYAADLFEDLQIATVPTLIEHTAEELGALLATMSFWARQNNSSLGSH